MTSQRTQFPRTRDDLEHDPQAGKSARSEHICVVGLGYVGLPLAVGFDERGHDVIGYDIDKTHIDILESGTDTTGDLGDDTIAQSEISFTANTADIASADYVIITVPTPLSDDNRPNLEFVEAAGKTVGESLTPGTTVVLESTVYPGATRDVLAPALETGGLTHGKSFSLGYSPERMTPGDPEHGLSETVKIVSGDTAQTRADLADLYETVVDAGVHEAPTIEVAEAAKTVENVQRDVNIALVNELAMAFEQMDIDTTDVLEAAGTKWNFHDYRPGLVGGHCIPVDPFYLAYRAEQEGYSPQLMIAGREVNEAMPDHIADLTVKGLNQCGKVLQESRLLVLGLSYKPNVGDIRSSKVQDISEALADYDISLTGYDPHGDPEKMREAFDIEIQTELTLEGFDGVVVATPHREFEDINLDAMAARLADDPLLVDVKGVFEAEAAEARGITYQRV